MFPVDAALLAGSAAVLSAALTLLCIVASQRLRWTAKPRADRWHQNPTPNTGGMAIFLTCAVLYLVAARGRYPVIAAAAAAMAFLGFLDDRIQLRPLTKFAGQSIAVIAVIASGVVFHVTRWDPVNMAITFLWIAGITNAFNLIDNMDGLCAGVTLIICCFRFWSATQNGDAAGALLVAMLAGAFLGFLLFNYKPARIFMGDGGSMFAGFTLASLAIAAPVPQTRVFLSAVLGPALPFLYPIFDTVLVSLLRRAAGRPISTGGRDHSSHRLASLGLGERKVVLLLWILTAAGSAVGLLTYWMPIGVVAVAAVLVGGAIAFGTFLANLPAYTIPENAPIHLSWVRRLIPTLRAGITVVVDVLLAGVALLAAFLLRWEDGFAGAPLTAFLLSLPVFLLCQAGACILLRTFNLGWRWFTLKDLLTVGEAVLVGAGASIAVVWMTGLAGYSRGVVILYVFLLFAAKTSLRFSLGFFWQILVPPQGHRRAALLGANQSADLLALILQREHQLDTVPVVILDTDPALHKTRIQGIPVRFGGSDPVQVLHQTAADLLILSQHTGYLPGQNAIIDACSRAGIPVVRFEMSIKPVAASVFHPVPLDQPVN